MINQLNLHLGFVGEDKKFPDEISYSFETNDNYKIQAVDMTVKERCAFKMGLEQNNYIEELMCEFNMNGVRGYGFCEINYRIDPY